MGIENLPVDVECDKCGKEFETTAGEFQDAREARNPILCPDCYVEVLDKQAEMESPLRRCFEYKIFDRIPLIQHGAVLNKHGADGWELIAIDKEQAYFKREYFSDIKPLAEEEI